MLCKNNSEYSDTTNDERQRHFSTGIRLFIELMLIRLIISDKGKKSIVCRLPSSCLVCNNFITAGFDMRVSKMRTYMRTSLNVRRRNYSVDAIISVTCRSIVFLSFERAIILYPSCYLQFVPYEENSCVFASSCCLWCLLHLHNSLYHWLIAINYDWKISRKEE